MTRFLMAATAGLSLSAGQAKAGASGLPWETPLQAITDSMSGPVLQSMLILAILISGVMIAFTEVSAGAKSMMQAVFGLSIAAAAVSFFPAFFNFAGAATY